MNQNNNQGPVTTFLFLSSIIFTGFGQLMGALIGQVIKTNLRGMDFALTALFVVLVIEQYRKIRSLRPFLIGAIVGIICIASVASQYMLLV